MTNEQNRTLLDMYSLSLTGRLEEKEIKDELLATSIAMDRAFIKNESVEHLTEYYSELQKLLEAFNMQDE